MSAEVHFQVGYLQAGAANGRVIVVTRTSEALSEIQLSARADGYRFNAALSAQSTTSGVARALASLGIAVFHAELSGPIPPGELELAASWPGSEVFTRQLHPIASALPDAGLAFVLGSCLYGNERFVETLASALERAIGPASGRGDWSIANPKFALFLGDNVYMDVHPNRVGGDADRHTASIYAKAFALSAASARVMSALPVLSTFDDHEFYDGYPETEPHVMRTWLPHVRASFVAAARDGIALFQQAKNPAPVAGDGCSFRFDIAPLSFFALDTRTTRTRLRIDTPELCREAEIAALETWAQGLTAPGVFVISQPLFSPKGSYIEPSFSEFQGQYERILKALRDAPFDIAVLSGDLHASRVLTLDIGGRLVTEVTSSPLVRVPSFAKNLLHRVFGGAEVQEPEKLEIPVTVKLPPKSLNIGCHEYLMGTTAPNSFALLRVRQQGADTIAVDVEFVDHAANRLALCERDHGGRKPRIREGMPCQLSFSLSRR